MGERNKKEIITYYNTINNIIEVYNNRNGNRMLEGERVGMTKRICFEKGFTKEVVFELGSCIMIRLC